MQLYVIIQIMESRVSRCNSLIKKIQRGNEKALDDLFVEFGPLFLNMAKKYLYNKEYAEDLLSEVFLDLLKSGAKSFDENKNGLDELEKGKSLVNFIDTANDFDKSLDNILISNAIKKLNEYENLLLYYRYWENLTVREIAQKLDKPKSTVYYEIKDILKKLKKLMDCE